MNLNIFLSIVIIALSMIYFLFEPMNIKKIDSKDIPQFSLGRFTLKELDKTGLVSMMHGDKAIRYSDRYEVYNIDFTDNSKKYLSNMKAKKGLYKRDVVYLNGDVELKRDDGLSFFSQKAKYDKKRDIVSTDTNYTAFMDKNRINGSSVILDNKKDTMKSKKIYIVYDLEEKKK